MESIYLLEPDITQYFPEAMGSRGVSFRFPVPAKVSDRGEGDLSRLSCPHVGLYKTGLRSGWMSSSSHHDSSPTVHAKRMVDWQMTVMTHIPRGCDVVYQHSCNTFADVRMGQHKRLYRLSVCSDRKVLLYPYHDSCSRSWNGATCGTSYNIFPVASAHLDGARDLLIIFR